jgi:hypothetical protein
MDSAHKHMSAILQPKSGIYQCFRPLCHRTRMTEPHPDRDPVATHVDLPSLLATTSARQAMSPTARMQARLTGHDGQKSKRCNSSSANPASYGPGAGAPSSSFNPAARASVLAPKSDGSGR